MAGLAERFPGCCMTSGDFARLLGVDLKTIHNWVRHGHLLGRRTQGRHLRFQRTEVVRFMRRFGYPVPESLGLSPPVVVLVGSAVFGRGGQRPAHGGLRVEHHDRLFDAALVVALGDYDVLVLELDAFGVGPVLELVKALRRRSVTKGAAIVGVGHDDDHRARFIAAGGDLVLASSGELEKALCWLTGVVVPTASVARIAAGR